MFYFLQKLYLTCLFLFEIKTFWHATTDLWRKLSSPILEDGMQMSWHCQIAGSQTNKSSKHGSMAPEFCKDIYQKIYLNDFRLGILGNKKV